MSLEDFELYDNETIANSIIRRGFSKVYRQQGANLNNPHQIFYFFSLEITIIIK